VATITSWAGQCHPRVSSVKCHLACHAIAATSVGSDGDEAWSVTVNFMEIDNEYFQVSSSISHYRELVSDPKSTPRVLQIDIQTAISHRIVSVIARTMSLARGRSSFLIGCYWQSDCSWSTGRGGCNVVLGYLVMFLSAGEEETEMDGNYVFLCGVMWCKFGQQDAGKELLRATNSADPDMKAMAWAMLAKGASRLRDLERRSPTGSRAILEENLCG
jgi:hypothetical protein